MIFVLRAQCLNDATLGLDLRLQILVRLLHEQNLLLLLQLLLQKSFFTLLLHLKLFLEFSKFRSLLFLLCRQSVATCDELLLQVLHHLLQLLLLVLLVLQLFRIGFQLALDLVLLLLLLLQLR